MSASMEPSTTANPSCSTTAENDELSRNEEGTEDSSLHRSLKENDILLGRGSGPTQHPGVSDRVCVAVEVAG
jgi:hypothetical protein